MEEIFFLIAQLITAWIAGLVVGYLMRIVELNPGPKVKSYMITVYTGWCVGCTIIFGVQLWRLHFRYMARRNWLPPRPQPPPAPTKIN